MCNKDVMLWRIGCLLILWIGAAAKQLSPNFEVEAPTAEIARQVADTAERCRRELAVEWLGHELPKWSARCQVRVKVGQIGAGGATTFSFSDGEVFGWNMNVQGSLERILDSVIPHEVSHTIFACHFRRPLPRWADEGAATLAEEDSERRRQQKLAEEVMPTNRRIPLRQLLTITEYPKEMQHVLTLYAEGYSLANYLIQQRGKRRFLTFVQEAHETGWEAALEKHYGEKGIDLLESKWSQWVIAGSPALSSDSLLAEESNRTQNPAIRSQTPETESGLKSDTTSVVAVAEARPAMNSGHSIRVRGMQVEAPAPRRRRGQDADDTDADRVLAAAPIDIELNPSPFAVSAAVDDEQTESRQRRGTHLTRPELRQRPATDSADVTAHVRERAGEHSHFATTATTAWSDRAGLPGRATGRSPRPVVPVQPVQERKSSLRFQPFRSR